jgi:DNA-binding MarR family transcriptional regulator
MATKASVRARSQHAEATKRAKPALVRGSKLMDDSRFDRLVYERVRLGMMSALAVSEQLTFSELKVLFGLRDGNLSPHARKLEEAGYVTCTKTFEARRPKSAYRLTASGRGALNRYLDHVEAVIKVTRRS